MNEKRLRGLMGLCVRAGQAVFGEDSCLKALRSGQAAVLLMDGGISEGSASKYGQACSGEGVPLFRLPEGLLEEATGRPGRAMAVRKGSVAEQIEACFGTDQPG